MPRSIALLVLFSAVAFCLAGAVRPCSAAEPWETQPYTEVPTNSALMRMAAPAPPQRPLATQRPASWPSSNPSAGAAGSGEVYVSDAAVQVPPANAAGGYSYPTTNPSSSGYPTSYPTTNYPATASPAAVSPPLGSAWTKAMPGAAGSGAPPDSGVAAATPGVIRPGAQESQIDVGTGIVAKLELCEEAKPLAVVGGEWILGVEIMAVVNENISQRRKELTGLSASEMEEYRTAAIRQVLQMKIESKLIYLDAKRHLPAENLPKIEQKAAEIFEEKQLPQMMQTAKVATRPELDAKLQALGTSLDQQKSQYVQQLLVQQWMHEQMKNDDALGPDELLAYYEKHLKDYEHQAQTRWQQLMVRFSSYSSKQEAWAAIAAMGNQIQEGKPFTEVAKAHSAGPTAKDGGLRPWTSQGSLVSKVLDEAIFNLPVGQLSQILEDSQGLHIVQVLERKPAGRTPFEEVQLEIAKKIREERGRKQLDDYLAKLRKEIPVWTIYDKTPGNPLVAAGSDNAPKP